MVMMGERGEREREEREWDERGQRCDGGSGGRQEGGEGDSSINNVRGNVRKPFAAILKNLNSHIS